ncbi:MAG: primase protein [Parcubacteria group bacterium GW2011_GWA2_39_18]|nr:MAG: primase protein [Parcubacteria group bacterium GW2011_GWA2_39_18]
MLSPIEEIKEKINIIDLVNRFVRLQKAGINYKANCPFHNEKTPSFFVSPTRQTYKCFGCGKGGDVFQFIQDIENVEFGDALRELARQAGVVLKREDPQIKTARQRLYEMMEITTQSFEENLKTPQGETALKYLTDRALKEETIKKFRVGFALDSWDALLKKLRASGYKDEEIEKAGLIISAQTDSGAGSYSKTSRFYDRFRARITFPVMDFSGQVVGFSARVLPGADEKIAKYINTPETLIYNKSHLLYGLYQARQEMRQKNFALVVEGNMDCTMSQQAGVINTIATSGTALTQDQLKIIKRYTENIVFSFDSDNAGIKATEKAIEMAILQEFNVKIMIAKEGKDPADFVKLHADLWPQEVEKAQIVMDFYFDEIMQKYSPDSLDGQKKIAAFLLPKIKIIPNAIERAHWLKKLSELIHIKEDILNEEMKKVKDAEIPNLTTTKNVSTPKAKSRIEDLAEKFLSCIKLSSIHKLSRDLSLEKIKDADMPVFKIIKLMQKEGAWTGGEDFVKKLPADLQKFISDVLFEQETKEEKSGHGHLTGEDLVFFADELKAESEKEAGNKIRGAEIKKHVQKLQEGQTK